MSSWMPAVGSLLIRSLPFAPPLLRRLPQCSNFSRLRSRISTCVFFTLKVDSATLMFFSRGKRRRRMLVCAMVSSAESSPNLHATAALASGVSIGGRSKHSTVTN